LRNNQSVAGKKNFDENPHEIRFTQITGDTRDTLAGMSSANTDRVFE